MGWMAGIAAGVSIVQISSGHPGGYVFLGIATALFFADFLVRDNR